MVPSIEFGWRHLMFENWPIDPAVMNAHLPDAFETDEFDGSAWLSVVPFTNVDLRPRRFPRWAGIALPELNVRTYVTYDGTPGVYFFSLDAQGLSSVVGARLLHSLPYYYAHVSLEWTDGRVRFESRRRHPGARPAGYAATYWPTDEPFSAPEDPFAEFVTERYRLYTEGSDGSIRRTDVEHESWTLYPAEASVRENSVLTANGFDVPEAEPITYYSPGLDVVASPSRRVS